MSPARTIVLAIVLAVGVAVLEQGLIRLVDASGAKDQPAVVLVLLLSAFLGLLTAVLTRSMRLPGAVAPTVLVLGWIVVPVVLGAIPSQATATFSGDAGLKAAQAFALAVAVVAATVTLGVQTDR
jgi:peptidoglycan/LPS O-acetylase OafA/YrhL